MKRYFAVLLAVLMLAGCAPQTPSATETTTASASEATTVPVDPGCYLPDSPVEKKTAGAIRAFAPEAAEPEGILCLQEGLLLLAGAEKTTLVLLEGENLAERGRRTLEIHLEAEDLSVSPSGEELAYYDAGEQAILTLDGTLRESRRIPLQQQKSRTARLSPDWKTVYYAAPDGLYAMDLGTGISRLIKQQHLPEGTRLQLCFNGRLLCVITPEPGGAKEMRFLSPEDGSTAFLTESLEQFHTGGDTYFFPKQEGSVLRYGCGLWLEDTMQLEFPLDTAAVPAMAINGAVMVRQNGGETTLDFVDLITQSCTASTAVAAGTGILTAAGTDGTLWLLAEQADGTRQLWGWALAESMPEQIIKCTAPFESWTQLDKEGLQACKAKASELGSRFGIRLLLTTEVLTVCPEGHSFEPEYLVRAYQRDLAELERTLAAFPEGFFVTAAEGTDSGVMTVSLVRSVRRNELPGENQEKGELYWHKENACMVLTMGEDIGRSFCHGLSHLIDNRVLGKSLAYDDWEKLNPEGFAYDLDYRKNRNRDGSAYLEGESRAFIDTYSMSFPREDRARILEYSMQPDCADYFQTDWMQKKLHQLCLGIREGFELPDGDYLWEQYLKEPIVTEED